MTTDTMHIMPVYVHDQFIPYIKIQIMNNILIKLYI